MAVFSKMTLKTVLPYSPTLLDEKKKFSVEDLGFQDETISCCFRSFFTA